MAVEVNHVELVGYLEEALTHEDMVRIEECLRNHVEWREALLEMRDQIDSGEHSVSTIWRRQRLTCAPREKLWAFLIGGLVPPEEDYLRFHLDVVKCRWCGANLKDLQESTVDQQQPVVPKRDRRTKFFQTSVGALPNKRK